MPNIIHGCGIQAIGLDALSDSQPTEEQFQKPEIMSQVSNLNLQI